MVQFNCSNNICLLFENIQIKGIISRWFKCNNKKYCSEPDCLDQLLKYHMQLIIIILFFISWKNALKRFQTMLLLNGLQINIEIVW